MFHQLPSSFPKQRVSFQLTRITQQKPPCLTSLPLFPLLWQLLSGSVTMSASSWQLIHIIGVKHQHSINSCCQEWMAHDSVAPANLLWPFCPSIPSAFWFLKHFTLQHEQGQMSRA